MDLVEETIKAYEHIVDDFEVQEKRLTTRNLVIFLNVLAINYK